MTVNDRLDPAYRNPCRLGVDPRSNRFYCEPEGQTWGDDYSVESDFQWNAILDSSEGLSFSIEDRENPGRVQPHNICRIEDDVYVYESHPILSRICADPKQSAASGYQDIEATRGLTPPQLAEIVTELANNSDPEYQALFCVTPPNHLNGNRRDLQFEKPSLSNLTHYESFLERLKAKHGDWRRTLEWISFGLVPSHWFYGDPLVEGFDTFIGPTSKQHQSAWENTGLIGLIKAGLLAVISIWGFAKYQEAKTQKGAGLINDISDDYLDIARDQSAKENYQSEDATLDSDTLQAVRRLEPMVVKSPKDRRGKYNPWFIAPNGWGKEGVMVAVTLRNGKRVEFRKTSGNMVLSTDSAEMRGGWERVLARVPSAARRRQKQTRKPLVLLIDEAQEEAKKRDKMPSVVLSWKDGFSNGDLQMLGLTTPGEFIDFMLKVLKDDNMKPLFLQRIQYVWAARRDWRSVAHNLRLKERSRRGQGYNFTVDDDAYELMAKTGLLRRDTRRLPREAMWILEGCPYVVRRTDVAGGLVEVELDYGHVHRGPVSVFEAVMDRHIAQLANSGDHFRVTVTDVVRALDDMFPQERAIIRDLYPDDARRLGLDDNAQATGTVAGTNGASTTDPSRASGGTNEAGVECRPEDVAIEAALRARFGGFDGWSPEMREGAMEIVHEALDPFLGEEAIDVTVLIRAAVSNLPADLEARLRTAASSAAASPSASGGTSPSSSGGDRKGWDEVMEFHVAQRVMINALGRADPRLRDFFRAEVATGDPIGTVRDLARRFAPEIIDRALARLRESGVHDLTNAPERLVFEMVASAAQASTGDRRWSESDPSRRENMVAAFESEMRDGHGLERPQPESLPEGPSCDPTNPAPAVVSAGGDEDARARLLESLGLTGPLRERAERNGNLGGAVMTLLGVTNLHPKLLHALEVLEIVMAEHPEAFLDREAARVGLIDAFSPSAHMGAATSRVGPFDVAGFVEIHVARTVRDDSTGRELTDAVGQVARREEARREVERRDREAVGQRAGL